MGAKRDMKKGKYVDSIDVANEVTHQTGDPMLGLFGWLTAVAHNQSVKERERKKK